MKLHKNLFALFLILAVLCTTPAAVYARETPDESRDGAITVEMAYDGKAVKGGTLTAYRVGRIQKSGDDYRFVKTPAMKEFSGEYDDISAPKLAEDVAAFVKENKIGIYAEEKNQDGKVVFSGLELGLYLIVQTKASDGYEPVKPFLVSIPMEEDGNYVYEINAKEKFQLHQKPKPSKPSKPSGPSQPSEPSTPAAPPNPPKLLPQTGQLNWPVPVLAALGLSLFSFGWILRFGKRRGDYEK